MLLLILAHSQQSGAQQSRYGVNDTIITQAIVYNGDTIELKTLENLDLYIRLNEAQMTEKAKYNRLRNAVYVTYPYARRAGIIMNDINSNLINVSSKSKRKKYTFR
jgi:hypothetical protein